MCKILLIMMVKNESRILERAFASASDYIDGFCLLDTGSTDNTVEIAERFIQVKKSQNPEFVGRVFSCPFKNFGYNRTKSFQFAKELISESNWDPETTYGLLLDADMVLKVKNRDKMISIIKKYDCSMLYQTDKNHRYYNIRLIKMSLDWKCLGVTHEYWTCDMSDKLPKNMAVIESDVIWIDDISDGGCKSDKFERDARLLLEAIDKEPEQESRYNFYLGQTYMCMEKYDLALKHYEKHVNLGAFKESIWFAMSMISKIYLILKKFELAEANCKIAFSLLPGRSEPLYEIARHYFLQGEEYYDKCEEYIKLGENIPFPKENLIYIDSIVYNFGFKLLRFQLNAARKNTSLKDLAQSFAEIKSCAKVHEKPAYVDDTLQCITVKLEPEITFPFHTSGNIQLSHLKGDEFITFDTSKKIINNTIKVNDNIMGIFTFRGCLYYITSDQTICTTEYKEVNIDLGKDCIDSKNGYINTFKRVIPAVFDDHGKMVSVMELRFLPDYLKSIFIVVLSDAATGDILDFSRPFYFESMYDDCISLSKTSEKDVYWLVHRRKGTENNFVSVVDINKLFLSI